MSENQDESQRKTLRHLFVPGYLRLLLELLVAIVLFVVVNFLSFESVLLHDYPKELTFTSYSSEIINSFLITISQLQFTGEAAIFTLWALIGMLTYILGFRIVQIVYGVLSSVNQGVGYVKIEHTRGLIHWLNTLHNFFVTIISSIISIILFSAAMFFSLGFATQQIHHGLVEMFPANLLYLSFGAIITIFGVRLAVMAVCIVMPRFARWYLA